MADIFLSSFEEEASAGVRWHGSFDPICEPGWYMHAGRIFLQGALDLAGDSHSDLDSEEEEKIAAEGETEDLTVSGVLVNVPQRYRPRDPSGGVRLYVDPYWCTPSFMESNPIARWEEPLFGEAVGHEPIWKLLLDGLVIPKGEYGELRLILSCWWDTPFANQPGAGANDDFEASFDFADPFSGGAGIANKGSRVWLSGDLECTGGPSEPEDPKPKKKLHVGAPFGPTSLMRTLSAGGPRFPGGHPAMPSPDYPDGRTYTIGRAGQGVVPIHVVRDRDYMGTGVFPTDRYTFYDVRPVLGFSKPQLGAYGNAQASIANPNDDTGNVVGLSGPTGGKGMSLFIGDIGQLPEVGGGVNEPMRLYLCLPQGAGGAGHGYYRFDLQINIEQEGYDGGPLVIEDEGNEILEYQSPGDPTVDKVGKDWLGPKVVFSTVNWADEKDGGTEGMEPPVFFKYVDVTGNGKTLQGGWGWGHIPPGQKSVLIRVVGNSDENTSLVEEHGFPKGAQVILFEWGEVGKTPFESREKGVVVFYDPTPTLTKHAPPPPTPPKLGPQAVEIIATPSVWFPLLLIGVLAPEVIREWQEWVAYEGEWAYWLDQFRADKPPGHIPPFGDAAIRVGGGQIKNGVPIWVSTDPLPPWRVMGEGEPLNIDDAGYASPGEPGSITIGPGAFGIVPKN